MTAIGRVLKAADVTGLTPVSRGPAGAPAKAWVLPRPVAEAKEQASQIIADAKRSATELRLQAAAEGRAQGVAELAAQYLALHARQNRLRDTQLQHSIALAKILAERLIGEAIQLDPALVGRMAQQSLQQLAERNALTLRAHPDDHTEIAKQVTALGLQSVSLRADTSLQHGELCIDSDLGQLELRIKPGLDRLVARVRSLLHDD